MIDFNLKKSFDELREVKRMSSLKKRNERSDSLPVFGGIEDQDLDQTQLLQSQ